MEPRPVTFHLKRSVGLKWVSEKAIADATVAFLNGARVCIDGQLASEAAEATGSSEGSIQTLETLFDSISSESRSFRNTALLDMEGAGISAGAGNDETRYRAVLRGLFCAFAQDPELTRKHILKYEIGWPLAGDAFFSATGISHFYRLNSYQNVVTVGSALLLDPKGNIGRGLCQCNLLTCRKFFWEIKVPQGRPKRRYCSPEHLNDSHAINAKDRTKLSRAKKKSQVSAANRRSKLRHR
jgi:hypothetical protein